VHLKPSRPQFLYFLNQTLPDFARDAAGFAVGIHIGTAPQSLHAAQPLGAGHGGANIQFNAWKPLYSSELRLIEPGFHVSTGQRQPVASRRRCSSGSLPRAAAPDLSSSFHGFIASDDGGSSAFSDSSDVEVDARSSVNARLSPASARSGGRLSAQRRPHTSSGLVGEASSDSRSLRLFHEQTSSARSLSTAALLRALSSSEPNGKPLQVSFVFHIECTRWTQNWNLTPYFR